MLTLINKFFAVLYIFIMGSFWFFNFTRIYSGETNNIQLIQFKEQLDDVNTPEKEKVPNISNSF